MSLLENKNIMNSNLDYFNTLPYEVILKKKEGRFILFIPELSCVAEDNNLLLAYEKLDIKKQEIFRDMVSLGLENEIKKPYYCNLNADVVNSLSPFIVKAIITCGVILFAALATIYVVHDSVRQLVPNGPLGLIRNQVAQVKHGLEEMNADEKKDLLNKIHQTILQIKPFTNELKILFQDSVAECSR